MSVAVPARDGGQSLVYLNDGRANFTQTIPFGPPDVAARIGAAADLNAAVRTIAGSGRSMGVGVGGV